MPEWFTGDARQVVACASEQARRLGHGFIGGEHLLYGLACARGEAGAVLRERGVTPERVEADTRRARKCLEGSLREARAHSGGHLGAEHIALALLAMDDGVPHRILSVIGASAPRLGAEIRDRCRMAG